MTRWVGPFTLVAAGVLPFLAAAAGAQAQEDRFVRIDTLNVRDTLYHLSDGGGNALALIDEINGGVVLVGTKLTGWGQAVLDAVYQVTDLPVTTIINTHAHPDHTGSNAEFPDVVEIIAHENTRASMARMALFAGRGRGVADDDLRRPLLAARGPRPHRAVLLRSGPHRRRHRGRVSGEADRVSGGPVPGQGGAGHRHGQRRERRRVPGHAGEGGGGHRRGSTG